MNVRTPATLLLFASVSACGARTPLDDPTNLSAPPGAWGSDTCAVTAATPIVVAPQGESFGWVSDATMTLFDGHLYYVLDKLLSQSGVSTPAIAELPLGGGAPQPLVSVFEPVGPAGFVVDESSVTYVDHGALFRAPRTGGPGSVVHTTPELDVATISSIAPASGGWLISVDTGDNLTILDRPSIDFVDPAGHLTVVVEDPFVVGTRRLVQDGSTIFGASFKGVFRIDGSALTVLATESARDIVVDETSVYYTLDMVQTDERIVGARIPKTGGAPVHYVSRLPSTGSTVTGDSGLAADAARVYFGDHGALAVVLKQTGEVSTLAGENDGGDLNDTTTVVVGDRCVYWGNVDQTIWAAPRPTP